MENSNLPLFLMSIKGYFFLGSIDQTANRNVVSIGLLKKIAAHYVQNINYFEYYNHQIMQQPNGINQIIIGVTKLKFLVEKNNTIKKMKGYFYIINNEDSNFSTNQHFE